MRVCEGTVDRRGGGYFGVISYPVLEHEYGLVCGNGGDLRT